MSGGKASVSAGDNVSLPSLSPNHCVINLNKPGGITSHQAVEKVRRMTGIKKAGHAGTLDPLATGILLVCTGEATKVTRFLSDLDKEYVAVVKLGEKTNTYDAEGEVIEKTESFSLEREDVERVLPGFTGTIEQVPPMYSAVKVGGQPLYKFARRGMTVERTRRVVTVHEITITSFRLPLVEVRVSCSKGTYIRSLCNDIGEALGVGAHITGLKRTRTGNFRIEDSITFDELEALFVVGCGVSRGLSGIDSALKHLGEISLTPKEFSNARNGLPVSRPYVAAPPGDYVRLKDPSGKLFAIAKVTGIAITIERMLHI